MNMSKSWIYHANITKIYDGDTITCDIDCGFGVWLKNQKIRLYGLNCPEIRGANRQKGLESRDRLREKILNKCVLIQTLKDKKGKYGRYLGIIYYNNENINNWLIKNKLAIEYKY